MELACGFDPTRAKLQPLERGTVAFAINSLADALDATNLLAIMERHGSEPVMDLRSIAANRGLSEAPDDACSFPSL